MGDLYTRSHTLVHSRKRVYWECSGCAIACRCRPPTSSGREGGQLGGPSVQVKVNDSARAFCAWCLFVVVSGGGGEPADGLRQLGTSGFFSSAS